MLKNQGFMPKNQVFGRSGGGERTQKSKNQRKMAL